MVEGMRWEHKTIENMLWGCVYWQGPGIGNDGGHI